MSEKHLELKPLTDSLMKEVRNYGTLEVSLGKYQRACNAIVAYASKAAESSYSPVLMERFLRRLDDRMENSEICYGYRRFQARVVRMLKSPAETDQINFFNAKPTPRKYPVSDDVIVILEDILQFCGCSDKTKSDLWAPIRHLFWYAYEQGCDISHINDSVVMKFLIEEVPVTNSGSTGRTLRCIKYVTEYLKAHGNTGLVHDYTMLKLKNAHIRIIPAFSEEEVSDISAAVNPDTPLGMRDLAVILLGYGTGLHGADNINMKLSDVDWHRQCVRVVQTKTHEPLTAELY